MIHDLFQARGDGRSKPTFSPHTYLLSSHNTRTYFLPHYHPLSVPLSFSCSFPGLNAVVIRDHTHLSHFNMTYLIWLYDFSIRYPPPVYIYSRAGIIESKTTKGVQDTPSYYSGFRLSYNVFSYVSTRATNMPLFRGVPF